MKVKYISKTKAEGRDDAEALMIYCARVSSPNQDNPDYERLLSYCIDHGHWSVFEMADMTVEIETSRAISPQLLRHRSFSFQEVSQRYCSPRTMEDIELRLQGHTKQGSGEVINDYAMEEKAFEVMEGCFRVYERMIKEGVSRETARMVLPLATTTKLYMKGSVRSWIHYLKVRLDPSTQKEHREIAEKILEIFKEHFPVTAKALDW